ncbi:MAG: hypothetical protein R3C01_14615 [Planctomycetaceae bacterium]
MTTTTYELPVLKIASPCTADWEEMTGDERVRFCGHCEKHVYNLTVMDPREVHELIERTEGKFCGRLYQRADGTALATDCPVGLARMKRLWLRTLAVATTVAVAVIAATWNTVGHTTTPATPSTPTQPLASRIRAWFSPPSSGSGMVMRDVCTGMIALPTPIGLPSTIENRPPSPSLPNE